MITGVRPKTNATNFNAFPDQGSILLVLISISNEYELQPACFFQCDWPGKAAWIHIGNRLVGDQNPFIQGLISRRNAFIVRWPGKDLFNNVTVNTYFQTANVISRNVLTTAQTKQNYCH